MRNQASRGTRRRTVVALATILAVLVAFVVRLVDIQVVSASDHVQDSMSVVGGSATLAGARGAIVDANGVVLAQSVHVYDAQLSPQLIRLIEEGEESSPGMLWDEASDQIAEVIGMKAEDLRASVAESLEANPNNQYLLLKRGLSTDQYIQLRALELPYLYMQPRETRVYPNGGVAGNIVGFLSGDGDGQSGIERLETQCLTATSGERTWLKGHDGVVIPGSDSRIEATDGGTVQTTIVSDLQWYLTQMLGEEAQRLGAKAATAVVIEVATGKIRAAVDWPTVDPNDLDSSSPDDWGARLFTTTYEPGSTFKAVTMATLLEEGAIDMNTSVIASSHETFPNGAVINDASEHPAYNYTPAGALIDSSNVAFAKLGTMVDAQTRHDYLEAFGVGTPSVGFPGEEPGLLHPVEAWDNQSLYTTTFGHYYTVTTPQVASAYQTIANGGERIDLSLIESCTLPDGTVITPDDPERTRVISEQTAAEVTTMLENVTVQGSLADEIAVPGYRIASKTGTAQKPNEDGPGYKPGVYYTSLVGFAPAEDPEYVVAVTLDEPTKITSSAATATAFQKAMAQVMKTFHVAPASEPAGELLPKFH